tara:strand:- start:15 stop:548 length:534 start_codon:yes stop_codon:yes gene_type:complete
MSEQFSNSLTRTAGELVTKTGCTITAGSADIVVSANTDLYIGQLVDHGGFIAGTKVTNIVGTTVTVDSTSSSSGSSQSVKFLGVTTAFASPSSTKSILIGGTFANNTNSQVNLTIEILDTSEGVTAALASKIPVPTGSSFVISDAGKTILEGQDEIHIYVDGNNAIDANLSILTGVN